MSRTIKFRGKRFDNGQWAYGYYAYHKDYGKGRDTHRIYEVYAESDPEVFFTNYHEVDHDTVGQYTGLKDKNGKEIYEGDILQSIGTDIFVEVIYNAPQFCYRDNDFGYKFLNRSGDFEVVGNIHDNPEFAEYA